jgi:hypothetical protein
MRSLFILGVVAAAGCSRAPERSEAPETPMSETPVRVEPDLVPAPAIPRVDPLPAFDPDSPERTLKWIAAILGSDDRIPAHFTERHREIITAAAVGQEVRWPCRLIVASLPDPRIVLRASHKLPKSTRYILPDVQIVLITNKETGERCSLRMASLSEFQVSPELTKERMMNYQVPIRMVGTITRVWADAEYGYSVIMAIDGRIEPE